MYPKSIIPPNIDYGKISAEPFSNKKSYVIGDLCIQYNTLWKFNSPKDPGAWDGSKVKKTTIAEELAYLKTSLPNDERQIGFYNGAPLYRKIIVATDLDLNGGIIDSTLTTQNIDALICCTVTARQKTTNNIMMNGYINVFINAEGIYVGVTGASAYNLASVNVFLLYTKL